VRLHRWILVLAGRLVPKDTRAEWRQEWEAELAHREATLDAWRTSGGGRHDLVGRTLGAFWDALWLRSSRWYSLRLFGRHWRLVFAAVLSLGSAIAATSVGVSAYNAVLLRPPAVKEPGALNTIYSHTPSEAYAPVSWLEYRDYATRTQAFSGIAAFQFGVSSSPLKDGDRSVQVVGVQTSTNFFDVLGIAPRAGRLTFRASGGEPLAEVAIGERLWQKLGADPSIVGRQITLNEHPVTVVGVVPKTFRGLMWGFNPDVWMPFETALQVFGASPTQLTDRTNRWIQMAGRRRPGVTVEQAAADTTLVAASIARERPQSNAGRSAVLTRLTLTPEDSRSAASMMLSALMLIVLLTLVVASANVTNLLFALTAARQHEMLVRAALGASRLQLVVPLVNESAALGLAAGACGCTVSWVGLRVLADTTIAIGGFFPVLSLDLRPNALVMAVTMAVSLAAGIAMGLAPALRSAAAGLTGDINQALAVGGPRKARARHALVIVQMAVATTVLVGVGVAIHSFVNVRHADLGFSARHLVFAGVDMHRSGFDDKTGPAFYEHVGLELAGKRGFESIALADNPPLLGYATDQVLAAGEQPGPDGHGAATPYAIVNRAYFPTLGIGLLRGRTFDSRDRAGTQEVVVVNATLARRHWPNRDPIGQTLRIDNGNRVVQVIGVVPDGKYGDIDEDPLPFIYFDLAQHYRPDIVVIARSRGDRDEPDTLVPALLDINPNIVLGGVGILTLDDVLRVSLLLPRLLVWTTVAFGLLAVALAVFGLYGTVFYAVSQRRKEIGIRTTLGATPANLFRLVLRESGRVAMIGAGIGLAAGLALLPLASSIFYGIGRAEPVVLGSVALASVAIALLTTYVVVRPWTRLTPSELLRS
jgi:putative ABC transport system permease protein